MQKKKDDEAFAAGRDLKSTIRSNIQNEEEDSKADASAKKIFRYKGVLSVLLKLCVCEYADCTLDEIADYMGEIFVSEIPVSQGLRAETVRLENTESKPGTEKWTDFDIYFEARLPKSDEKKVYRVKIDLEIQKTLDLKYPIENRAAYYLARELSGQLDYVYEESTAYQDLCKVFTIWVA